MFGPLDQGSIKRSDPENRPGNEPVVKAFAVLDAARVMHLPKLLQGSGLTHRCLFKGQAYEDLKNAGPWLVELKPENTFTRNLFTSSDAPWHLWRSEPGIFIRSAVSFDDLYKHLRKFTMITDESGAAYYFRFWEPDWAVDLLSVLTNKQASAFLTKLSKLVVVGSHGEVHLITQEVSLLNRTHTNGF